MRIVALELTHFVICVRSPGDILVRGLSLVRPTLRVLTMEDCNICGTGLPPSGCLPAVERLAVGGKTLLACKYQHLGTLSNLCSLTLTGARWPSVRPHIFPPCFPCFVSTFPRITMFSQNW